jgi:hypothetical protein
VPKQSQLTPEFIELLQSEIAEGVLYVSMIYGAVIHKCCCGCGEKVVTPLSPTDWKLTFDGESVSLYPSIGNWSFPCQSHYWIQENKVKWAPRMSKEQIEAGRAFDRLEKERHYGGTRTNPATEHPREAAPSLRGGIWSRIRSWIGLD